MEALCKLGDALHFVTRAHYVHSFSHTAGKLRMIGVECEVSQSSAIDTKWDG